mmetsp:Transcript_7675/g.25421  ORF Transcript_7675/g.25421 Transcript_7675/m.25421 type:complete len:190 (-) Transcript_7675:63-632(-)
MAVQAHFRGVRVGRRQPVARRCRATTKSAVASGEPAKFVRFGVLESTSEGCQQQFGVELDGKQVKQIVKMAAGSEPVPLTLERPLGIVFEAKDGACVVDELVEGGNAAAAGVLVGDVLRLVTAVAPGESKVTVGDFQVEPSMDMRSQAPAVRALFDADGQPFNRTMDAIVSNADAGISHVALLLERPKM